MMRSLLFGLIFLAVAGESVAQVPRPVVPPWTYSVPDRQACSGNAPERAALLRNYQSEIDARTSNVLAITRALGQLTRWKIDRLDQSGKWNEADRAALLGQAPAPRTTAASTVWASERQMLNSDVRRLLQERSDRQACLALLLVFANDERLYNESIPPLWSFNTLLDSEAVRLGVSFE